MNKLQPETLELFAPVEPGFKRATYWWNVQRLFVPQRLAWRPGSLYTGKKVFIHFRAGGGVAKMKNQELEATWHFHDGTKHPGGYLLNPYHHFDGSLRPRLFKIYRDAQLLPLAADKSPLGMPALRAIAAHHEAGEGQQAPDRAALARLLYLSAGITKHIDYGPGVGEIAFRAAACTGALYHIELYVVCGELPDLEAGVYHFDPRRPGLTLLRRGDYRRHLVEATAGAPGLAEAPLILVYSDVYWRNAVKYQARAYRHTYWDSGTILANTLAVAAAQHLPAQLVMGFVDDEVNRLLELDPGQEFAIALLPVGANGAPLPGDTPALEPLPFTVEPLPGERRQPAIVEMHQASCLERPEDVVAWRGQGPDLSLPEPGGRLFPLQPLPEGAMPQDDLAPVIVRRGSSRRFRREPISWAQLSTVLRQAVSGVPGDFGRLSGLSLNHVYLIVNGVDGLPGGAYVYHWPQQALELLRQGDFRDQGGQLALGQELGADASVNVYFLCNLQAVLERFGNRGYRAAQLEASVTAGRIYLAAYGLGLGASGLTFFDDAVTHFFRPHSQGKSVMFLMTVGQPGRRR